MKLNLLPTHVGRERNVRFAVIVMILMIAGSAASSVLMVRRSAEGLAETKRQALAWRKKVDDLNSYSAQADTIVARGAIFASHINLAREMDRHNPVYPQFYKQRVFAHVPRFFRLTEVTAIPNGADSVTVTMRGIVKTYQQYNDLLLAMMRIPGATGIQRSGYQTPAQPFLTPLTREDQQGQIIRPNEGPLPKDPLDRLDAMIARGGVTGFLGQGGYGTMQPGLRGPMPDYSLVTVSVVIPGVDLTTPNPRATLNVGAPNAPRGGGAGAGGATG